MAKQEATFWQITTLTLCLVGLSFPICMVQAYITGPHRAF